MKTFKEFVAEQEEWRDPEYHHNTKVGKATVGYTIDHNEKKIHIGSVRVPQAHRRQGHAHAAIKHVTDIADKLGYHTDLGASPLDKKTSTGQLVNMYQKHGFKLTGRHINAVFDPEMVREPKK